MRPLVVITLQPFGTDLPDLVERLEHIGIQHFGPIGSIEALDECILIGSARLDIPQVNAPVRTPGHESVGDQLRAIVEANRVGLAPPAHHLL